MGTWPPDPPASAYGQFLTGSIVREDFLTLYNSIHCTRQWKSCITKGSPPDFSWLRPAHSSRGEEQNPFFPRHKGLMVGLEPYSVWGGGELFLPGSQAGIQEISFSRRRTTCMRLCACSLWREKRSLDEGRYPVNVAAAARKGPATEDTRRCGPPEGRSRRLLCDSYNIVFMADLQDSGVPSRFPWKSRRVFLSSSEPRRLHGPSCPSPPESATRFCRFFC